MENANYVSAEKGLDVDVDRLYVKRAIANDGPRMKRIRPAPMGRAYRYQRRISHLEIAVEEKVSGNGKADLVRDGWRRRAGEEGSKESSQEGAAQEGGSQEGCGEEEGTGEAAGQEEIEAGLHSAANAVDQSEAAETADFAEKKQDYGTKSPSVRIPPRHHQAVEVALVRGA